MYGVYCLVKAYDAYDRTEPMADVIFTSNDRNECVKKLAEKFVELSSSEDESITVTDYDSTHLHVTVGLDTYEYYRVVEM